MSADATIAIVGMGALGSRMADRLAGAATLRCIDRDVLEPDNLDTSPLYTENQVERGLPKAVAAEEQLAVEGHVADLHGGNADTLLAGADLLLDGSDTVATRRILNAWAVKEDVPWIHTAALNTAGNVLPVIPGETACYACLFDHADGTLLDTCTTAGLTPYIADAVAATAVAQARRILDGDSPAGLTRIRPGGERTVAVKQRDTCPVCVEGRFDALEREGVRATRVCGDGTYHVSPTHHTTIELDELAENLGEKGKGVVNEHLLRVRGETGWMTVFPDGRAVVEADSVEAARRRYARVVGS